MSSFLPEKCYVVCTKHMGLGYRQLERAGGQRAEFTVVFRAGQKPWLTREDKKLSEDFACKTQWSSPVALASFGAGLGTAVALGAAFGWIPVAGQILLGVLAVAAIGYAIYSFFANRTKCSDRLASPASQWVVFHQTVTFNGFKAINKRSILQCQEGGSLLPFISESLAAEAARSIGLNNLADVGINALATYVSGLFFGLAFTGVVPALSAAAQFIGGMFFGCFVIKPATEFQESKMREGSEAGGEMYENMNREPNPSEDVLGPDTEYNPLDVMVYQEVRDIRRLAIKNGATKAQIAQLDGALRAGERNGSYSPEKTPEMRPVIENIKNGVYGDSVRRKFTNRSGNMRGMNRRANYEKAVSAKKEVVRVRRIAQAQRGGKVAGNVLQLIQPFASTYFSEKAREYAAIYAQQDLANDVGFVAKNN